MILTIRDIEPSELGYLYCSDRRLAEAVSAVHQANDRIERSEVFHGSLGLDDPYSAHSEEEVQV